MNFDIAIVGGGLAGLSLAVALRQSRLSVALVEGRPPVRPAGWDARVYAVSPANVCFLDQIGAWRHLERGRLCPIETMVVQGDEGGRLDFSAYDAGAEQLAWIVESSLMQGELWESAKRQANVRLFCPGRPQALEFGPERATLTLADGRRLHAGLVVAADGADSWTRQAAGIEVAFKPYDQLGVVTNFECDHEHRNQAFQWFRADGVLAYLPLPGRRISIVWSTPEAHGRELLALDEAAFCRRVEQAGNHALGGLRLLTPAAAFPLRLMRAPRSIGPRLALIGDAAHTIHPLSGHGINLGFQDAQALAHLLCSKPDHVDCGALAFLRAYERARKEEVVALQTVTDGLQRLFSPVSPPLSRLRNLGMNLTNGLPVIKNLLVRYALAS